MVRVRRDGSSPLARLLDEILLVPGYDYAEAAVGTTAASVALHERADTAVAGPEHFHSRLAFLSGAAGATGIPASYWWWLGGITVSLLGSQVQAFGLGWVATAHGASVAGLVITAGNVPGLVLMLIGGAVADSRGPWPVMVVSDGLMCAVTAALAVTVACRGTPVWLLLSAAVLTGVSSAFYVPSSGTIPRRLVPGAALGQAMAARTMAGQLVSTLGAPVGGVVVAVAGLAGAAGLNSASFAVIFVLLLAARRRFAVEPSPAARSGTLLRRALAGAGLVARDSLLCPLLAIIAAVALCLLPVMSLLVPLLVRSHGWPASAAGELLGAEAVTSGVDADHHVGRLLDRRVGNLFPGSCQDRDRPVPSSLPPVPRGAGLSGGPHARR